MGISRGDVPKKIHAELNDGIDTLRMTKNHLESFQEDIEATVTVQLKSAKAALKEKRQGAKDAMIKTEKLMESKKEETVEAVAEWKVKRRQQKLAKRAERAEEYADASVMLASYYTAAAELAILEAITARQDAKTAMRT